MLSGKSREQWDKAAGVECSCCRREVFRVVQGMCPQCAQDEEFVRQFNRLARRRRLTPEQMEEARGLQVMLGYGGNTEG